ncbi:MAG: 1-phosphofructokinase [Eubacterium sp.]|nr:1-phosphofructokinase [Eubacterium sp.]MCM1417675.1 1-phosphofructokinase [Roseburia sp.]
MIYTVTFNPAIDYVVRVGEMTVGGVNRAADEQIYFGGKGINVSVVLAALGVRSRALGFIAGFTGEAIERGIAAKGIETDFVRLERGFSRINVKIKAGAETELNGQGPEIGEEALTALYQRLDRLADGDTLVLAGSIPKSLPPDIYEKILERLKAKKLRVVVDAAGALLLNTLKYRPFLIKPNRIELGELFGASPRTIDEIAGYAARLKEMGARNVLVSMAGDGAFLLDEDGETRTCRACRGTVKNSVGAGDSMVAGFLAGIETGGYDHALRLGTAAGGATAFSDGLAEKAEIDALLKQIS